MNKYLYDSFQLYFNSLAKLGYKDYQSVEKLIVLIVVNKVLKLEITKQDYEILQRVVDCLQGTDCMLPLNMIPCKHRIPINIKPNDKVH